MLWRTLLGASALACSAAGCGNFDSLRTPDEPPVPAFARSMATDDASDVDDPMRSQLVVADIADHPTSDLIAFYRDRFPASAGWKEQTVDEGRRLCLVRSGDHVEVVRIDDYQGSRVPAASGRYLLSSAVFEEAEYDPAEQCRLTHLWTPTDLLGEQSPS